MPAAVATAAPASSRLVSPRPKFAPHGPPFTAIDGAGRSLPQVGPPGPTRRLGFGMQGFFP
ncbi:uncharacterized protein BDZ99DRAFT_458201 [Mytilinidion resinicola]|uniref:Uncharacterized protein n=1 Tax=Mytilinidion resinicola TaxID=574789 RepID=A0A6A6Z7Y4_9PEZI|nr:uncharacterized protein BDZ99DRAFT_458201 [Mytilinidion resinicola]KAF2816327.1 hypothetical protein BDZ99DRAFT_458201 [Mytilinidion resinicola]